MFKTLRRGFIRMNMLVLSGLVLVSFAVVYLATWSNTQQEIREELELMLTMPNRELQGNLPEIDALPARPDSSRAFGGASETLPGFTRRLGFAVKVTPEGYELGRIHLFLNADELDVDGMLARVDTEKAGGSFAMGEHRWAYRLSEPQGGSYNVAFLETSEATEYLRSLILVFAVVTVVLLLVIWFVSRWFAGRSVAPIEEAYNQQRRFVQDASHDLKTPVTVIQTNLELLASHPEESVASQGEWVENIRLETAHMEQLTSRLLALAKAEAEAPPAGEEEVFSLAELVRDCVLPLEAVMYEKELHFDAEAETDVQVMGERDELRRLLHILMENAIQYTPKGGRITLRLETSKRKALLAVANTGPGIPADELPHVFDRFHRGDAARRRGGNHYGLGLSIARGIAARHKGQLGIASVPGQLTTATLTLPLA